MRRVDIHGSKFKPMGTGDRAGLVVARQKGAIAVVPE